MAYRPGKCRLHHILREKRITFSKLSELTGIKVNQLYDYANNHRPSMSLATAFTIAIALGVLVEELYEIVEY